MNLKSAVTPFRTRFRNVCKETITWFPGHMTKAIQDMQRTLKQVDCVLEVHDARIPVSGRDPYFHKRMIGTKPHILVLNKKDLIDTRHQKSIESMYAERGIPNVLFTNSKNQKCRGLRRIIPMAADLIYGSARYNRSEERQLKLMVVGIPNVGKSSVINALRSKKLKLAHCAPVGGIAGITRSVQELIKVNQEPPMYLVDTPGILSPQISDVETGMKLALCSCLQDHNVGIETIADYALYVLNKTQSFIYVDYFNLSEPNDNIMAVLSHIAKENNRMLNIKAADSNKLAVVPNYKFAAQLFVSTFRNGLLGQLILDTEHFSTNADANSFLNQKTVNTSC